MSVIVVLSDCPPKLRGDMTKWFIEINTGVYVGNFNARVRDNLWQRITENIGHGHATMVYNAPGEQHMDFRVHNAYWEPVDFDGIKLMRRPEKEHLDVTQDNNIVVSNISKHRLSKKMPVKQDELSTYLTPSFVVLDFETSGLDANNDEIIEIGAMLIDRGKEVDKLQIYVRCRRDIPVEVTELTGVTRELLKEKGTTIENAIRQLLEFSEDLPFVCHNSDFEQAFLNKACNDIGESYENRFIDTLILSRKLLPNMGNHKLSTLADYFGITYTVRHRAITDCEVTYAIYTKLMDLIRHNR